MQNLDTNALFTQYINVVNRALGENRDRIPYKHLIPAADRVLGGRELGVAVYQSSPDAPHDFFTIKLEDGTFDIVSHGKKAPDVTWRVKRDHLENVVDSPQTFIESPMKLDLDWLKTRVLPDRGN